MILPQINAWWETGHMIVAQIAKNDLLKTDEQIYITAEQLSFYGADLSPIYTYDFVYAAVWADDIKSFSVQEYDNWHFLNLPINNDGITLNFEQGENNNAAWAIEQLVKTIRDKRLIQKKSIEKAVMLRLLTHILGDIHQPLHASAFCNGTYNKPEGDAGGNKYYIIDDVTGLNFGNLHYIWDSGFGLLKPINERPISQSSLTYVRDFSVELMKNFTRKDLENELKEKIVLKWAQESLKIARRNVYATLNGEKKITKEYQLQSFEIIKRQLALAGYRLADKLREALQDQDFLPKYFVKNKITQLKINKDLLSDQVFSAQNQ